RVRARARTRVATSALTTHLLLHRRRLYGGRLCCGCLDRRGRRGALEARPSAATTAGAPARGTDTASLLLRRRRNLRRLEYGLLTCGDAAVATTSSRRRGYTVRAALDSARPDSAHRPCIGRIGRLCGGRANAHAASAIVRRQGPTAIDPAAAI